MGKVPTLLSLDFLEVQIHLQVKDSKLGISSPSAISGLLYLAWKIEKQREKRIKREMQHAIQEL